MLRNRYTCSYKVIHGSEFQCLTNFLLSSEVITASSTMLLLFMSMGRDDISELRPPTGRWCMRMSRHVGVILTRGKPKNLGKPLPVPLCPPQIPHGLSRQWTRVAAVRGRRLTTWVMAQPRCQPWSSGLHPEDEDYISYIPLKRNNHLQDHTASQPRRPRSTSEKEFSNWNKTSLKIRNTIR
jgi:hypothetical protein